MDRFETSGFFVMVAGMYLLSTATIWADRRAKRLRKELVPEPMELLEWPLEWLLAECIVWSLHTMLFTSSTIMFWWMGGWWRLALLGTIPLGVAGFLLALMHWFALWYVWKNRGGRGKGRAKLRMRVVSRMGRLVVVPAFGNA